MWPMAFPPQHCHVCHELVEQADAVGVWADNGTPIGWAHKDCA